MNGGIAGTFHFLSSFVYYLKVKVNAYNEQIPQNELVFILKYLSTDLLTSLTFTYLIFNKTVSV